MSAAIRAYCFKTPDQWAHCLLSGFTVQTDGSLLQAERLGSYAVHIPTPPESTSTPETVDAYGQIFCLRSNSGPMTQSPRLIVDHEWVWWFEGGQSIVRRSDIETLQWDLELDVEKPILDIASDGLEGIWILCGGECPCLIHFDCKGRLRQRYGAPYSAASAKQLVSLGRGTTLALLTRKGSYAVFVDAATGQALQQKDLSALADGLQVKQFVSDARDRIAVWGVIPGATTKGLLFLLDSDGNVVDGPLDNLFGQPDGATPPHDLASIRIAVNRQTVWLFTDSGVWRVAPSDGAGARESLSSVTTPALFSPATAADRGWLRAEASVALSRGAVLEVHLITTNDKPTADQATSIAHNPSLTDSQKQDMIWALFDPSAIETFSFPGPTDASVPIAIPLLEPSNQWAWLRLSLITPPGTDAAPLTKLRVLYPNLSIENSLPAIFRGANNDPTGNMRSLVGVLESTTQQVDERIRAAASYLDPSTTSDEWLNYLARWFDLPWDDALPIDSKRRLLASAGQLLEWRGTRTGLQSLLQSLVGPSATVEFTDVTVECPPVRLGGGGQSGGCLPALLPGVSLRTPTLGSRAVIGHACLGAVADPLAAIVPTLRIRIFAAQSTQNKLEDLLGRILLQYIPAGLNLSIRWRDIALVAQDILSEDGFTLDGPHVGSLGADATIGQSRIGGRDRGKLGDTGFGMGRLQ
jgi:phage tail-like protein